MNAPNQFPGTDIWTAIETEKRRDRIVRRIGITAWSVTLVILLGYAAITGYQISKILDMVDMGAMSASVVIGSLTPLIAVVGFISLIIAVLATVGVFLRLRTSSLADVQMRLAAIEEIILARNAEQKDDLT